MCDDSDAPGVVVGGDRRGCLLDPLLLASESIWAGRGRGYGRCNIFTQDGKLVANYTQDCMVRAFPEGGEPASGSKRVM